MIGRLEGVLVEQHPTRVVIDVCGVGYDVHIPLSTFTELPEAGKRVALHVHTHARDGSLQLFGFASRAERAAFELLLRASRVGPRLAQTVLSGISPRHLLDAIRSNGVAALRAVPGIGTKLAERILVELRDRADELEAALGDEPAVPHATPSGDPAREETLSALVNLGYPRAEAERVIAAAAEEAGPEASLETLVRASLRRLSR